MQQPGFLSKLYEIKPFKIVQSPETFKKPVAPPVPITEMAAMPQFIPSMQQPINMNMNMNADRDMDQVIFLQQRQSLMNPKSASALKIQHNNVILSHTPNRDKATKIVYVQNQNNGNSNSNKKSSQRFMRKFSAQETNSPLQVPNFHKTQSLMPVHENICSPTKTPNKENNLPLGTMIQSHLYTNLSSSIDTLFSKIEKIKQEFNCPNSAGKLSQQQPQQKAKKALKLKQKSQEKQKQKQKCGNKFKMVSHNNLSQISGYSPILKNQTSLENPLSDIGSILPVLEQQKYQGKQKQKENKLDEERNFYFNNKNILNCMYNSNNGNENADLKENRIVGCDVQSVQSFDPLGTLVMPVTHNYINAHAHTINQMSSKTKTIIDEINSLLQSNRKNNPYKQKQRLQKQKNSSNSNKKNKKIIRKIHTLNSNQPQYDPLNFNLGSTLHNPLHSNPIANLNSNIIALVNPPKKQTVICHQYDQLDDQFMTIKLKPMQSQYAPTISHKNSGTNSNNRNQSVQHIATKKQATVSNPFKTKPSSNYNYGYNTNLNSISNLNICYKLQSPLKTEPNCYNCSSIQMEDKIVQAHSREYQHEYEYEYENQNQNRVIVMPFGDKNLKEVNFMASSALTMSQFQLGKCIGSGKFGDVHICKHKSTGFIFALKKIFKSTLQQYNMIPQLTQQLKIHYSLQSPHITKLFTHFSDQYHIFLLLEYLPDGNLLSLLPCPEPILSPMISQLLSALQSLHRNRIAHRDLKPQNILLSYGTVKICDFGWSSIIEVDRMKRTFCGTLDYVSPQMKDRGEYGVGVDLWSVGVLVYEMLVGVVPNRREIEKWRGMGAKIGDKWDWRVEYPETMSREARGFVSKLLKEDPEDRISIRECRQEEFITKYERNDNEKCYGYLKQFQKVLG